MEPYNRIRTCAKEAHGSNSGAFGKGRNVATHLLWLRKNAQLWWRSALPEFLVLWQWHRCRLGDDPFLVLEVKRSC
jgi:hypothetical protein